MGIEMNSKRCYILFAVAALSLISVPVFSQSLSFPVPDSSEIRKTLVDTWFEAPLSLVRQNNAEVRQNLSGIAFQVHLEESADTFAIFVSPEEMLNIDVYSSSGINTVPTKVYPGDAPGSWVLVRNKNDGSPVRIVYYFTKDSDIYLSFSPAGGRTSADMIIYGQYAAKNVPVGVSFDRFYTASFDDVLSWTGHIVPWHYAAVSKNLYHGSIQMMQVIRKNLPRIVYSEDAMYDEYGKPVYLSNGKPRQIDEKDADKLSLSSAGFVKWIVDGLVEPISGGYLKRKPLLVQTVAYMPTGFPGTMSEQYNLSFALDWTRNLAAAAFSVRQGVTYLYKDSAVDVRIEPFAAEMTAAGSQRTAGYIKDSGYAVKTLKALLYVLAATEPNYFYLGAVRQTDMKSPEVKVFNQSVVFIPYFDSTGRFACAVFRNGTETTLEDFMTKFKGCFVNLVRIETSDRFFPQ
jgi:hypothetical protein